MTDTTTENDVQPVDEQQNGNTDVLSPEPTTESDTFPREYVEKLRQEAAEARVKAKKADDYAKALFHARVASLGRLADPADLPFDQALLEDHDAMIAAVDQLVAEHPHYATRTPRGDVGQGITTEPNQTSLADLLRRAAS